MDSVPLTKKPEFVDIMTYDEYKIQSDAVIVEKLRYRHLLVTGIPDQKHALDKSGLCKLTSMNRVITIHGL